ncbi:hypothetical protein AeNC1_010242 [Aphanomyces euteiches]|nr:hypothetical protein AeNC1_010242 [Aphanomyces euteiches]
MVVSIEVATEQSQLQALQKLDEQCVQYQLQGNYVAALECMERALVLRRHFFGLDSTEVRGFPLNVQSSFHDIPSARQVVQMIFPADLPNAEKYTITLELLKKAEILTEHHPQERATTLNNMACYYRRVGKLHGALSCLKRALAIEIKLNKLHTTADTHLNLCAVYSTMGKHTQAIEHVQSALSLLQEELFSAGNDLKPLDINKDRVSVLCIAYHNLGVEQEYLHQYSDSVASYQKGVGLAEQYLGAAHGVSIALTNSYVAARRTLHSKAAKETMTKRPTKSSLSPPRPKYLQELSPEKSKRPANLVTSPRSLKTELPPIKSPSRQGSRPLGSHRESRLQVDEETKSHLEAVRLPPLKLDDMERADTNIPTVMAERIAERPLSSRMRPITARDSSISPLQAGDSESKLLAAQAVPEIVEIEMPAREEIVTINPQAHPNEHGAEVQSELQVRESKQEATSAEALQNDDVKIDEALIIMPGTEKADESTRVSEPKPQSQIFTESTPTSEEPAIQSTGGLAVQPIRSPSKPQNEIARVIEESTTEVTATKLETIEDKSCQAVTSPSTNESRMDETAHMDASSDISCGLGTKCETLTTDESNAQEPLERISIVETSSSKTVDASESLTIVSSEQHLEPALTEYTNIGSDGVREHFAGVLTAESKGAGPSEPAYSPSESKAVAASVPSSPEPTSTDTEILLNGGSDATSDPSTLLEDGITQESQSVSVDKVVENVEGTPVENEAASLDRQEPAGEKVDHGMKPSTVKSTEDNLVKISSDDTPAKSDSHTTDDNSKPLTSETEASSSEADTQVQPPHTSVNVPNTTEEQDLSTPLTPQDLLPIEVQPGSLADGDENEEISSGVKATSDLQQLQVESGIERQESSHESNEADILPSTEAKTILSTEVVVAEQATKENALLGSQLVVAETTNAEQHHTTSNLSPELESIHSSPVAPTDTEIEPRTQEGGPISQVTESPSSIESWDTPMNSDSDQAVVSTPRSVEPAEARLTGDQVNVSSATEQQNSEVLSEPEEPSSLLQDVPKLTAPDPQESSLPTQPEKSTTTNSLETSNASKSQLSNDQVGESSLPTQEEETTTANSLETLNAAKTQQDDDQHGKTEPTILRSLPAEMQPIQPVTNSLPSVETAAVLSSQDSPTGVAGDSHTHDAIVRSDLTADQATDVTTNDPPVQEQKSVE